MNLLRRRILTLVGLLMAAAVGIALGVGPLSAAGERPEASGQQAEAQQSAAPPSADPEAAGTGAEQLLAEQAPRLYADGLAGSGVVLLVAPEAVEADARGLAEQVRAAGGRVVGTWELTDSLLAPSEKTLVETLAGQLSEQAEDPAGEAGLRGYELMGALLGRAVATGKAAVVPAGDEASAIRASLSTAGLLEGTTADAADGDAADEQASEAARAPHVVVLLGPDAGAERDIVLSGLVAGLAPQARSTAVVAPAADPALGRLRGEDAWADVATVDGGDTLAGQVRTLLTILGVDPGEAPGKSGADDEAQDPVGGSEDTHDAGDGPRPVLR